MPNRTPAPEAGQRAARIGYARVSTDEQNLALQIDALEKAGCTSIFRDNGVSGAIANRPALTEALEALSPGDVLVTWKLDRLGRSLAHLIEIVTTLNGRGVGFQSLSETIDTTTAGGMLFFHMMGALAEFERALISERTRAGMAAARTRGVRLGRPPKLNDQQVENARRALSAGTVTCADLAEALGVSRLTLVRAVAPR